MKKKFCFLALIFVLFTFVGCSYEDLNDTTKFKKEVLSTEYTILDAESYLDPDLFTVETMIVDIGNNKTYKIGLSTVRYDKFVDKFGDMDDVVGTKIPVIHTKYYDINTGELYTEIVQINWE